jgi:hypothetical protein
LSQFDISGVETVGFIIAVSQSASTSCSCFCSFIHLPYSYISGITLLGTPTEIYVYGTQYIYILVGVIAVGFVMNSAYLPVFHSLQLTSAYEVNLALYYFANSFLDNADLYSKKNKK